MTKVYQVEDAVKAAAVELSAEEIETMEKLGDEIGVSIHCQREEIFEKMHRL